MKIYVVVSDVDPNLVSSYGYAGNPLGPWIVGAYTSLALAQKADSRARRILTSDKEMRANNIESDVRIEEIELDRIDLREE